MFIEFEGIQFLVRRISRRKTITISLRPNGNARISASISTPREELEIFLAEKREWVRSVSQRFVKLRSRHPKLIIEQGAEIPFLGGRKRVSVIKVNENRIRLKAGENFTLSIPHSIEDIRDQSFQEKLRQTFRTHYKNLAVELLTRRTEHWQQKTGLIPKSLSFRGQKTRWGSCSPRGKISLNWKLICAEPEVIDYVIIHELCHLQHLNHSKNFWNLVECHCPDWREKRKWLQKRSFDFDFLNMKSELHQD